MSGEQAPILEGPLKLRDGKKWKNRYARITRLSPVADFLTLQLWKDLKEFEKQKGPTKGSISLSEYLGVETGFNLDKESNTIALIFRDVVVILALENREVQMKWQVRLTNQFEEGQQYSVHLVSAPKKAKLSSGSYKIHLQNQRFSLTHGIPPVLLHTWSMIDLRRYGAVDGGRFCFEGGTRCGKGEGLHVFRVDNPEDLQISFDLSSKGKLESKKRSGAVTSQLSHSPSVASSLSTVNRSVESGESGGSGTPLIHNGFGSVRSREEIKRTRSRSRSKSINTGSAWASLDNGLAMNSPDTMSLTLSESEQPTRMSSPDHLVDRRAILDRVGLTGYLPSDSAHSRDHGGSRSCGSESEFHLNWNVDRNNHPKRQGSIPWTGTNNSGTWNSSNRGTMDRVSMSSGDSLASSNYDQPKTVLKVTTSPLPAKRSNSYEPSRTCSPDLVGGQRSVDLHSTRSGYRSPGSSLASPPLTPRSLRRTMGCQDEDHLRRKTSATPCSCSGFYPSGYPASGRTSAAGFSVSGRESATGYPNPGRDSSLGHHHPAGREGTPGYQNYDIPRNLGIQDNSPFYDTPRSIKAGMNPPQVGPMGNYDIPGDPMPVPPSRSCACNHDPLQQQQQQGSTAQHQHDHVNNIHHHHQSSSQQQQLQQQQLQQQQQQMTVNAMIHHAEDHAGGNHVTNGCLDGHAVNGHHSREGRLSESGHPVRAASLDNGHPDSYNGHPDSSHRGQSVHGGHHGHGARAIHPQMNAVHGRSRSSCSSPSGLTDMTWTCLSEDGSVPSEVSIPRVKLTGQGRMPVVDMSKINTARCFSEPPSTEVESQNLIRSISPTEANPNNLNAANTAAPVYAQIDRSKKSCSGCNKKIPHRCTRQQTQIQGNNYTNLEFAQSLSLYENSRDVLSRLKASEVMTASRSSNLLTSSNQVLKVSKSGDLIDLALNGDSLPNNGHCADEANYANGHYLQMIPQLIRDYELMNFSAENGAASDEIGDAVTKGGDLMNVSDLVTAGDGDVIDLMTSPERCPVSAVNSDRLSVCSSNYADDTMALMSDSRFDTIKMAPKSYTKVEAASVNKCGEARGQDEGRPKLPLLMTSTSSSYQQSGNGVDGQTVGGQGCHLFSGYVTIPRSKGGLETGISINSTKSQSPTVTMRRSASVPCKQDRNSTGSGGSSSSDSGVSTGSPRQSTFDQISSFSEAIILASLSRERDSEKEVQTTEI